MAENTATIWVRHLGGDRLGISVRAHELFADQPVGEGGEDSAPTPTELFLASLAACVAFYAERVPPPSQIVHRGPGGRL